MNTSRILLALGALLVTNVANATLISFSDTVLASGNPVAQGGTTLTTSTTGGSIGFIGSGIFTGLHLGGSNTSGGYTLSFSQAITSIEIEFDALSSNFTPVETLFNFTTNLGAVGIGYTNQSGTSFDGSTISATLPDGQGIITYAGAAFTSFSFDHNQANNNGFVIERLVINTAPTSRIPEPGTFALLSLGLFAVRRFRV